MIVYLYELRTYFIHKLNSLINSKLRRKKVNVLFGGKIKISVVTLEEENKTKRTRVYGGKIKIAT